MDAEADRVGEVKVVGGPGREMRWGMEIRYEWRRHGGAFDERKSLGIAIREACNKDWYDAATVPGSTPGFDWMGITAYRDGTTTKTPGWRSQ